MKKLVVAIIILALILIDFAALDDITTGSEPSFILEYSILTVSAFIFTILIWHHAQHRLFLFFHKYRS